MLHLKSSSVLLNLKKYLFQAPAIATSVAWPDQSLRCTSAGEKPDWTHYHSGIEGKTLWLFVYLFEGMICTVSRLLLVNTLLIVGPSSLAHRLRQKVRESSGGRASLRANEEKGAALTRTTQ